MIRGTGTGVTIEPGDKKRQVPHKELRLLMSKKSPCSDRTNLSVLIYQL